MSEHSASPVSFGSPNTADRVGLVLSSLTVLCLFYCCLWLCGWSVRLLVCSPVGVRRLASLCLKCPLCDFKSNTMSFKIMDAVRVNRSVDG